MPVFKKVADTIQCEGMAPLISKLTTAISPIIVILPEISAFITAVVSLGVTLWLGKKAARNRDTEDEGKKLENKKRMLEIQLLRGKIRDDAKD